MEHDPLCPTSDNYLPDACRCHLIAKARADEREKAAQRGTRFLVDVCGTALSVNDWRGLIAAIRREA